MKKSLFLVPILFASFNTSARPFIRESAFQPIEIKSLDSCFSPVEKCDVKLISFILQTKTQLDMAIFSITHSGIANAIKQIKTQGLPVRMIVDREQSIADNSKIADLKAAGIQIKYGVAKSMMHNKFTLVDLKQLETGSYNYTMNATNNNLENQIYISDEAIVKKYTEEFERMWTEALAE